jgi:hypothetical protein
MKTKIDKKVYSYKENALNFNVDAQIAGEAIDAIRKENNGECDPETLVDISKNKNHPLHSIFDWNDESATRKQRIQMARQLIGSITVTFKHHEGTRAFISVKTTSPIEEDEKRTYIGVDEAVKPNYEFFTYFFFF